MSFFKRFGLFFLLVLLLTVIDFFYLGRPSIGIDDANIFFTYAKNLSHGQGFVFNAGGEKVEGFTSLLWVLICTAFYCISSSPEWMIMIFLLLLTSLTITIVFEELKKDIEMIGEPFSIKYFFWIYCAFIFCIGPSFITWSVLSMMENGLWNFLFISLVVLLLQAYRKNNFPAAQKTAFVTAAILLIFTRPEGMAWCILFCLLLIIVEKKNRRSISFPVIFILVLAATTAALTYFRLQYFGYAFPNTYYAKVSHNRLYNIRNGLEYAIDFIITYHPVITFFLAIFAISIFYNPGLKFLKKILSPQNATEIILSRSAIIVIIILTGLALPLTTGGDHFGGFRFYQGILLLFSWGLPLFFLHYKESANLQHSRNSLALMVMLFLILAGAGSLYNLKSVPKTQLNYEFFLATEGRQIAKEVNAIWSSSKPSVGVVATGGFALDYQGQTVDLMGLNNVLMGHNKGDRIGIKNHAAFNKDVFYQLHPDLVLPKITTDEKAAKLRYADLLNPNNFENQAMKNIFNDTAFQNHYTPVMIFSNNTKAILFAFANTDFMNTTKDSSVHFQKINF